ncbi:transposase family protein [Kitasatospora sp. NPDC004614]|uniref:transposase family protein n=1 Tax=Kitasatospora sp. NPDC004614 TaxID=3364016 RepID=UPI0036904420
MRVHARGRPAGATRPSCETWSERVHSGYERRVADAAVSGRELVLHLRVRRFLCDEVECGKRTFVEQITGLTFRHGRYWGCGSSTTEEFANVVVHSVFDALAAGTGLLNDQTGRHPDDQRPAQ